MSSSLLSSKDLTLVVGDVHIAPGQNLRRADWLGWAIKEIRPQRVLFIGDLMSFDCVSGWDKDKRKKMEGRRYTKDIASGLEFFDRMTTAMGSSPLKYTTPFILLEGNHEDRLRRYFEYDPTMDGAIDYLKDLGIAEWTIIPYKKYWSHKGAHFTHIPINEAGKPIGGKYVCDRALGLHQHSVIFGHTHKLSSMSVHRHGAKHLSQALNVGCYFEHIDDYALGSVTSYWRGLVLVDHYKLGRFNWTPISMGKLEREYNERSV